jgi:hypothetical protein
MNYDQKVSKFLNNYQQTTRTSDDQRAFFLGICYCQIGDYSQAKQLFEASCLAMFKPPMLWQTTGQPNWLIDICILSGRLDLVSAVRQELAAYKLSKKGKSLMSLYSYKMIELIDLRGGGVLSSADELTTAVKAKDINAIGICMDGIIASNPVKFNSSLETLLDYHSRQATIGSLRATAEGLLCMPAMSLVYAATTRGLEVEKIDSNYISMEYLKYVYGR